MSRSNSQKGIIMLIKVLLLVLVYGASTFVLNDYLKLDGTLSLVVSVVVIFALILLDWTRNKKIQEQAKEEQEQLKEKRKNEIEEFLNDLSPELQRQTIEKKPKWIRYLKDQTCELCMIAVKNDLEAFSFITDSKIKEEIIEKLDLKNNLDFVIMQDAPDGVKQNLK